MYIKTALLKLLVAFLDVLLVSVVFSVKTEGKHQQLGGKQVNWKCEIHQRTPHVHSYQSCTAVS